MARPAPRCREQRPCISLDVTVFMLMLSRGLKLFVTLFASAIGGFVPTILDDTLIDTVIKTGGGSWSGSFGGFVRQSGWSVS